MKAKAGPSILWVVIALVAATFCLLSWWSALHEGGPVGVCHDRTDPPAGAVIQGETVRVAATGSLVPLGVWCTYALENGGQATRYADIGTLPELVAIGGIVLLLVRAIRWPRSGTRLGVALFALGLGALGATLGVAGLIAGYGAASVGLLAGGIAALAVGGVSSFRWFARYREAAP